MKLLVSAANLEEAVSCIEGGADIIDVKNPKEGSLGGCTPQIVKGIAKIVPDKFELSAAIGDVSNKPGLIAQAALGLATCGVGYIKIGLCDDFSVEEAIYLVKQSVDAVKEITDSIKTVICAYADAELRKIITPKHLPYIVKKGGANVAMIDTFVKGEGKGLFDYVNEKELHNFQSEAYDYGLEVALAGGLKKEDVLRIKKDNLCDFIGIRTLACRGQKRDGRIDPFLVREIKNFLLSKDDLSD